MKIFSLATFVVVAGIGESTSHDQVTSFPFIDVGMIGHVLAVPLLVIPSSKVPSLNRHAVGDNTEVVVRKKGPCRAHRFSQKAVEVSNIFREALGLPIIKIDGHPGSEDGRVRILPFVGSPNTFAPVHGNNVKGAVIKFGPPHERPPHHGPHHHVHGSHRHHRGHHHLGKGSFINRIHYSIMNLGRWEGRAVAFVLGKIFQSFF